MLCFPECVDVVSLAWEEGADPVRDSATPSPLKDEFHIAQKFAFSKPYPRRTFFVPKLNTKSRGTPCTWIREYYNFNMT